MRFLLLLVIPFINSCTQQGAGATKKNRTVSPVGTTTGGDTTGGTTGGSSGTVTGVSMRYAYPAWPTDENAHFYYVPSFSDLKNKETSLELAAETKPSDDTMPVMPLKYSSTTSGKNFCFSNEEWVNESTGSRNFPICVKAASSVVSHIKSIQNSNSGLHPVFINAVQFNFKNAPESAGGNYSEVFFDTAYVEKATFSFNETTGLPVISNKTRYNYGTGQCNIEDQDAVGFEVADQASHRFFLSGIASFERARKKVFGEGTLEDRVYEATECTSGSGEFLCNLIADRVNVWHALFVPLLYKNNSTGALRLSHRQFPNQVVSGGRLSGTKGSAISSFGYYAEAATSSPTALANSITTPVMGKFDRDGNLIPNWEQSFITGFCLKGRRKEKLGWTSLVKAMYFELKSPRINKITTR